MARSHGGAITVQAQAWISRDIFKAQHGMDLFSKWP
jgi:hypothetical protein